MSDKISIQFVNGNVKSVVLFEKYEGEDFLDIVNQYLTELDREMGINKRLYPLDRREPSTVIVDFIRWLTKNRNRVEDGLKLGKNEYDGHNEDNGHFIFDLTEPKDSYLPSNAKPYGAGEKP